jgi:hypothetical protein
VYREIPMIFSQLVFLYAFDALLSWSRGRKWRIGCGPLPIVLSTNVFIWFVDDWYVFQYLLMAVGALGKEFIKWNREGKRTHIFNPSAFTLAVFSIVLIATNTTYLTRGVAIATTLALPPHIYLEIFLLGLVVQYFFAVTLMTFSAAAVLILLNAIYNSVTGTYYFIDTQLPIAIFLGLHLLMTDPSTSPRTKLGRVVFGGLYGFANFVLYLVFQRVGIPEFYDKLLPVPVLNLSVQVLDRFARSGWLGRLTSWEARFQPKKSNLVYMGAWAALFLALLTSGSVDAPHPGASIEFWKKAYADGKYGRRAAAHEAPRLVRRAGLGLGAKRPRRPLPRREGRGGRPRRGGALVRTVVRAGGPRWLREPRQPVPLPARGALGRRRRARLRRPRGARQGERESLLPRRVRLRDGSGTPAGPSESAHLLRAIVHARQRRSLRSLEARPTRRGRSRRDRGSRCHGRSMRRGAVLAW